MDSSVNKYIQNLVEIKDRLRFLTYLHKYPIIYKEATTESIYLQIRKILELIMFCSLVANKEAYISAHRNIDKHWNAKRIMSALHEINQDFYPKALIYSDKKREGIKACFDYRNDSLTKEEFIQIYDECGKILHSNNPFGTSTNYNEYFDKIPFFRDKIMSLLSIHEIKLLDSCDTNIFVMNSLEKQPEIIGLNKVKFQQAKPQQPY